MKLLKSSTAGKRALISAAPIWPALFCAVLFFAAGIALAFAHTAGHAGPHAWRVETASRPGIFFWAWDEPEDMRALAGRDAGVAYLAATMLLDESLHVSPRFQPLVVASGTPMISVVRVETRRGFHDAPQLRRAVADAILDVARRSGAHAVQVDFDATQSEREFYAAVLRELRTQLPPGTTLSITALLSWCAHDDWIHALPIDEAVPMYFRLGREAHNVLNPDSSYAIREPLCSASVGIATDEPSPNVSLTNKRMYVFNPRPWNERQLRLLAKAGKQ